MMSKECNDPTLLAEQAERSTAGGDRLTESERSKLGTTARLNQRVVRTTTKKRYQGMIRVSKGSLV